MTHRSSILILLIITLVAWGGLLVFTRFIPPQSFVAFFAFFLLLSVALSSTLTPTAYIVGRLLFAKRRYRITFRHAIRQGATLTLLIVFNLILRALHSWNIFTTIVMLVTAIVIEILFLAKK